ncbi:hypothetical protein RhiTH_006721 [Rhizoctonia solani]
MDFGETEILINPLHRVTFGSGFSGNTPEVFSAASKDALIARLTDQLDERENQIAEQEERIENQIQEIQELKREAETRNQHLEELNIAVNKLLIRLAEGNASAPITQPSSNDHIESEVSTLREQVSRIESALSQWRRVGDISERPNNMTSEESN